MIKRMIPSSGVLIPVIGLGTWQTFDVGASAYPQLKEVLMNMFEAGGRVIDSSPMYGRSEKVIGDLTNVLEEKDAFFYATKVWIEGEEAGKDQMKSSMQKMKRKQIDLIQIHNLVDWKTHLRTLRHWKEQGIIKYIGITHYKDHMHDALEKIIRTEQIDFVQFNYSITSRNAEKRLLPAAKENGVATLINRPFGEGRLFNNVINKPLPPWANDSGINNWSQYFLKYLLVNEAVTCIIPGTSNPKHITDNMEAGHDPVPDENKAKEMLRYLQSL